MSNEIDELLGENDPESAGQAQPEVAEEPRDGGAVSDFSIPARYREALLHVVDDVFEDAYVTELGRWLYANRDKFLRGGDDHGISRFNYELTELDKHYDGLAPFRKRLTELYPEACEVCEVDDFALQYIECHATLYHHGSHFCWHDDAPGYDGEFVPSRRITFCYYMHTDPKMFMGGELEFLDGTRVEPANNRLVFFHPLQQHQIRKVECWSAHPMHGRWCFMGWIHGDPPPGYSAPSLRGHPRSG